MLPHPLRLRPGAISAAERRARFHRAAALGVLALALVVCGGLALDLANDWYVWSNGRPAASAEVTPEVARYAIVERVALRVAYVAGEGLRGGPDGTQSYLTLSDADRASPCEVRWLGRRSVTSWSIAATNARLAAIAALAMVFGACAGLFFLAARRAAAEPAWLARVAELREELELPILSVHAPKTIGYGLTRFRWGRTRYRVLIPAPSDAHGHYRDAARVVRQVERDLFIDGRPLTVGNPARLVALRDPRAPLAVVALGHDLWPFVDERADI